MENEKRLGSIKEISDEIEKRRRQNHNGQQVKFLKCLLRIRLFNGTYSKSSVRDAGENGLVVSRSEKGNTHPAYIVYEICL